ncbi:MAG: reductive dehalogenase domain-containing protein [Candidatus Bathyarchaeia archaeon]
MKYRDILYSDVQLGPYPTHLLKYVDKPTTRIVGPIERPDPEEHFFSRALRGDFGKEIQEKYKRLWRYPVTAALVDIQKHISTIAKNEVAHYKAPISEDPKILSRHFKSFGYFLGADIVGIGRVPEYAYYTHDEEGNPIEPSYKYAIVFVVRKHENSICASNGWDWIMDAASFQAYVRLAIQSECVANYIRRLGYEAEASHMLRYLTVMPPILLEAGIGEICRMGIVLNPFLGVNFKASCVLTNLELEVDGPIDFGLQEYCRSCKICAEQCPAGAIPHGDQILYNGYYTWKLNTEACGIFCLTNKEGTVCGRCAKVCPWHRPNTDPRDFANWDGDIAKLHKYVNEQRQKLINNNFVDPAEKTDKWWFDLDEVDGRLTIPKAKNKHKVCREYPLQ